MHCEWHGEENSYELREADENPAFGDGGVSEPHPAGRAAGPESGSCATDYDGLAGAHAGAHASAYAFRLW